MHARGWRGAFLTVTALVVTATTGTAFASDPGAGEPTDPVTASADPTEPATQPATGAATGEPGKLLPLGLFLLLGGGLVLLTERRRRRS